MLSARTPKRHMAAFASGCGLLALLSGCSLFSSDPTPSSCALSGTPLKQMVLANGLDDQQLLEWAQASQGSRLLPQSWFDALEQPGGGGQLADPDYLARFGLITDAALAYPVGMALDCQDDSDLPNTGFSWYEGQNHTVDRDAGAEPWIGLTCAACHTGNVTIDGVTRLVAGAPARFDYQSFVEALDQSLAETHPDADSARFDRFAEAVFAASGQEASENNRKLLTDALDRMIAWQAETERRNFPQGDDRPRYGFSRVDAFGHIYNKITIFAGAEEGNPSTAPVSYPFLWGIQEQNTVQWNGLVANARLNNPLPVGGDELIDYGALGRNTGEVLGVFGDLAVVEREGQRPNYVSSARVNNLMRLEELVGAMKAPQLGDFVDLGEQETLVTSGRALFVDHCQDCHLQGDARNDDGGTEVNVSFADMASDGNLTDINMACNAMLYSSTTGTMAGTKTELVGGRELAAVEPVSYMLEVGVKGVMANNVKDLVNEVLRNLWGMDRRFDETVGLEMATDPNFECRQQIFTEEGRKSLQYKARPLDGIWATGPYLHNGSVRTLYQLLLPPDQRESRFWVGSAEYDADEVGFRSVADPGDGSTSLFDTTLSGNSNAGHVYGARGFSESDRAALLAYMRTL
ncbi:MAG: di-heme-cytochrome C peroxidase [Pseudomonadota bacterium]